MYKRSIYCIVIAFTVRVFHAAYTRLLCIIIVIVYGHTLAQPNHTSSCTTILHDMLPSPINVNGVQLSRALSLAYVTCCSFIQSSISILELVHIRGSCGGGGVCAWIGPSHYCVWFFIKPKWLMISFIVGIDVSAPRAFRVKALPFRIVSNSEYMRLGASEMKKKRKNIANVSSFFFLPFRIIGMPLGYATVRHDSQ